MQERRVVKAESAAHRELESRGWVVIARSWGAGLTVSPETRQKLAALLESGARTATIRELLPSDVDAVMALDQQTLADYPGDVATAHEALTVDHAVPTRDHRGWGAFASNGLLVAMTFTHLGPDVTETDFTVVHRDWRNRGLGTAVKAASVLVLSAEGRVTFRTGGSSENRESIAANRALGYTFDEEWLTLVPAQSIGCQWPCTNRIELLD